jgi:hypothetical protein
LRQPSLVDQPRNRSGEWPEVTLPVLAPRCGHACLKVGQRSWIAGIVRIETRHAGQKGWGEDRVTDGEHRTTVSIGAEPFAFAGELGQVDIERVRQLHQRCQARGPTSALLQFADHISGQAGPLGKPLLRVAMLFADAPKVAAQRAAFVHGPAPS